MTNPADQNASKATGRPDSRVTGRGSSGARSPGAAFSCRTTDQSQHPTLPKLSRPRRRGAKGTSVRQEVRQETRQLSKSPEERHLRRGLG